MPGNCEVCGQGRPQTTAGFGPSRDEWFCRECRSLIKLLQSGAAKVRQFGHSVLLDRDTLIERLGVN